jgi:hypothetical protein
MPQPYALSCHCGSIRIEVDAELTDLVECNCSTCARSGFLHWYVPKATVRLITESRNLSTYIWRGITEGHHFCPICGIALMRSGYPNDRVSINARCLDAVDIFTLTPQRYDGRTDMPPGPMPARS